MGKYCKIKDINQIFSILLNNEKINRNDILEAMNCYKNKFYKTDHHWNINGALNGYYDILDMFDITDNNTYKIAEKKERKYYGSMAKTALNDIIYDYISDINYIESKLPLFTEKARIDNELDKEELSTILFDYVDKYLGYSNEKYYDVIKSIKPLEVKNFIDNPFVYQFHLRSFYGINI